MKQRKSLDSFALLAYLNGEPGFVKVRDAMETAQKTGAHLLINEMNLAEVYYILRRQRGAGKADYFLETIVPGLPVRKVANDFDLIIEAAKIKADYPIAFSDCFAVATAVREKVVLLTGDPEFRKVQHLIEIEWINQEVQ